MHHNENYTLVTVLYQHRDKYGTLARLKASNGQLRVSTLVFQFRLRISVTAERRHNLLRVALAMRYSSQREIKH